MNGHLGWLTGAFLGVADINLIDRCWGSGRGVINTTFNGNFDYTSDSNGSNLVSSIAGNITCNYKLQKPTPGFVATYTYVNGWFFAQNGTTNMLGDWDVQDFWYSQVSGRLNIPAGTVINIGPERSGSNGAIGETFSLGAVDINIGGTIVERCNDASALCDNSQSAHTHSNTLMYIPTWSTGPPTSTRIIYNGATIVVRDQDSQIITTPVTGGTIGIYSAGLNTNKMDAFEAEQEKLRVTVAGIGATVTINGEVFSGGGGAVGVIANTLVTLINASGTVGATASQDTVGVDGYIYVESDTAGIPLLMAYGFNTILDTVIRYNTQSIYDNVGGTLIEDPNITKDLFN